LRQRQRRRAASSLRLAGALLLVAALSVTSGRARAGELEDCNGPTPVETACTAVIDDASRRRTTG